MAGFEQCPASVFQQPLSVLPCVLDPASGNFRHEIRMVLRDIIQAVGD